jgi:hypothetical protein
MHITRQAFVIGLAATLGLISGGASRAAAPQKLTPTTAPIDVLAEPAIVVVGSDVTLRGSSLTLKAVRIEIQPPEGPVERLTARLDKSDSYSIKYRTRARGKHAVTAFSPGGKS